MRQSLDLWAFYTTRTGLVLGGLCWTPLFFQSVLASMLYAGAGCVSDRVTSSVQDSLDSVISNIKQTGMVTPSAGEAVSKLQAGTPTH